MAAYKTIADIVTAGLKDGGNPGISTRATAFLIAWLDHMALAFDWEFFLDEATITTVNRHEISLAGITYRNVADLRLTGITAPLQQVGYREIWNWIYDATANNPNGGGIPEVFSPTPDRSKLLIFPRPTIGVTYAGKLLYYKRPDPSAMVGSTYPAFEDVLALERGVAHYAQVYDKEPMQLTMERLTTDLWGAYRTAHQDKGRNKPQTMKWGTAFTKMEPQ